MVTPRKSRSSTAPPVFQYNHANRAPQSSAKTAPLARVTRASAPATMCTALMAPVAFMTTSSVCVPGNGATAATWTACAALAPNSAACACAQWATAPDQMLCMPSPGSWWEIPRMARAGGKDNTTCNVVYGNCCSKDGICGEDCGGGWWVLSLFSYSQDLAMIKSRY